MQPILDHLKSKFSSSGKDDWVGFITYHQSEAGLERKSTNPAKAAQAMF